MVVLLLITRLIASFLAKKRNDYILDQSVTVTDIFMCICIYVEGGRISKDYTEHATVCILIIHDINYLAINEYSHC